MNTFTYITIMHKMFFPYIAMYARAAFFLPQPSWHVCKLYEIKMQSQYVYKIYSAISVKETLAGGGLSRQKLSSLPSRLAFAHASQYS